MMGRFCATIGDCGFSMQGRTGLIPESACQEHSKDGIQVQGREAIMQRLSAMADLHAAMGSSGHNVDSIKIQKAQAKPLSPLHNPSLSSLGLQGSCVVHAKQQIMLGFKAGCTGRLGQLYLEALGDGCIAVQCSNVRLAESLLQNLPEACLVVPSILQGRRRCGLYTECLHLHMRRACKQLRCSADEGKGSGGILMGCAVTGWDAARASEGALSDGRLRASGNGATRSWAPNCLPGRLHVVTKRFWNCAHSQAELPDCLELP